MFKKIKRMHNYNILKSQNNNTNNESKQNLQMENIPISLKEIKSKLEDTFIDCTDFIMREIVIGKERKIPIIVAYIDGLVDKQLINLDILKPLMFEFNTTDSSIDSSVHILLKNSLLSSCTIDEVEDFNISISFILSGDTLIYIDGSLKALKAGLHAWDKRTVEEPATESVVRGPREGFSETLRTNTSLLRRKIKNSKLKLENIVLGEQTKTDVCICYIQGVANKDIVETVKKRLKEIKIDAILESGYIEEFIEDAPYSIFPTVGNSEKPDVVAAKILEGRVAILCDGTPFVLTVPYLFIESLQASDDYYNRSVYSIATRIIRGLALFITSILPALYVAALSFHQQVIPFRLLISMAVSKEGIPFTAFYEALLMIISFELVREAGIRMPKTIGSAVSIVGALIIGDASVKAGLVSAPMVVIIAITSITSLINPVLSGASLLIRIALLIASSILGILGIILMLSFVFLHVCSLESFGVPYLSPLITVGGMDLKDTLIRVPIWAMLSRPKSIIGEHSGNAKYRANKNIRKKDKKT